MPRIQGPRITRYSPSWNCPTHLRGPLKTMHQSVMAPHCAVQVRLWELAFSLCDKTAKISFVGRFHHMPVAATSIYPESSYYSVYYFLWFGCAPWNVSQIPEYVLLLFKWIDTPHSLEFMYLVSYHLRMLSQRTGWKLNKFVSIWKNGYWLINVLPLPDNMHALKGLSVLVLKEIKPVT